MCLGLLGRSSPAPSGSSLPQTVDLGNEYNKRTRIISRCSISFSFSDSHLSSRSFLWVSRVVIIMLLFTFLCYFLSFPLHRSSVFAVPFSQRSSNTISYHTPIGTAVGQVLPSGKVARFVVEYATATRWGAPTAATTWHSPNNDPTADPPACPQPYMDSSQYNEACLYLVIYVPLSLLQSSSSPNVFFWIHGGSNYFGSATYGGLDGSQLALTSGSIVAVVQYRLGVLGFLPPTSASGGVNLGVQDVTQALTFIRSMITSFRVSVGHVTVAGQSSGADLIRALLASPTAAALFTNGILQSDPMFWNFLPHSAYTALQTDFYHSLPCPTSGSSASNCLASLSLDTLLNVQSSLLNNASTIAPAAGSNIPLRPFVDGHIITTSLSGSSYPSTLKPLLLTTVMNEAGSAIAGTLSLGTPSYEYPYIVEATFGDVDNRSQNILSSDWYGTTRLPTLQPTNDQTRTITELLGTDASWRCPNWSWAQAYAAAGGNVWVGRWMLGATYWTNAGLDYCTTSVNGVQRVCHQDDIYITFGTTPSPSSAQTILTTEIQARWSSFLHTSNPNPVGGSQYYGFWQQTTSSTVQSLQFGLGGGQTPPGGCGNGFWGTEVQYDWQLYGVQ